MNSSELKSEAGFRIYEYEEMEEWYKEIMGTYFNYMVYVSPESYILALILEKTTGTKIKKDKVLTSSSFLLNCRHFAEYYKKHGHFPYIILCDNVLTYGKNINHIIYEFEKEVCRYLSEEDSCNIKQALVRAIRINVFVINDEPKIILGRYELNIDYKRREEQKFLRHLSNNISLLIRYSNISVIPYIYSSYISDEKIKENNLKGCIQTSYQNVKQHTLTHFIKWENQVKAICTLSLTTSRFHQYRILPFIFLPNLEQDETDKLLMCITDRMGERGFTREECDWVLSLNNEYKKQSLSEFITMVLGKVMMDEYMEKEGMQGEEEEREKEIEKLSINYMYLEQKNIEKLIRKITSARLFTMDELELLILNSISDKRKVLTLPPDESDEVSMEQQFQIIDKLEAYFYDMGYKEECTMYKLASNPYRDTLTQSKNYAKGCGFFLVENSKTYDMQQVQYMVSYILQMADSGALLLSSHAPSHIKSVGYVQYIKNGKQSLLLEILKYFEYIPVLSSIYKTHKWERIKLATLIENYSKTDVCDLSQATIKALISFNERLSDIGQSPFIWDENYLFNIDPNYHIRRHGLSNISEYMKRQNKHTRSYYQTVKNN